MKEAFIVFVEENRADKQRRGKDGMQSMYRKRGKMSQLDRTMRQIFKSMPKDLDACVFKIF